MSGSLIVGALEVGVRDKGDQFGVRILFGCVMDTTF